MQNNVVKCTFFPKEGLQDGKINDKIKNKYFITPKQEAGHV